MDLRAFFYLRDENWPANVTPFTHSLLNGSMCFGCDLCDRASSLLKSDRCQGDDDMVWKADISDYKISELKPGDYVMGNIRSLGWAVLKCSGASEEDLWDCVLEKRHLVETFEVKHSNWYDIQSHKNMQFPDLVLVPPSQKVLFENGHGIHYMKYHGTQLANQHITAGRSHVDSVC